MVLNWDTPKILQRIKKKVFKPILQYFDVNKPVHLNSKNGLGAALLQNYLPMVYASKALKEIKKKKH